MREETERVVQQYEVGESPAPSGVVAKEEPARRPRVSVLTVFLNAERFLQEAIESVLAQTYGDWELLLVDDGSTDGGSGLARSYAERYPHKVVYLNHGNHSNLGISASQNLGISRARGEYIAFLDSDDV